jgi:YihY family inner membrane protein
MSVLSFFPFMTVLISFIRRGIESREMSDVLLQILRDHLPIGQTYVINVLNALVNAHKKTQVSSLILIFLAARGVFIPLEVALNHIWKHPKPSSWVRNQVVGLGLTLTCALLALASVAFTAGGQFFLNAMFGGSKPEVRMAAFVGMKLVATASSITIFFLIYWLVPSGNIAARQVFPAAVIFGTLWEAIKYFYVLALPHLNFQDIYGPFSVSVALLFWGYVTGVVLLAGGYYSASPAD